MRSAERLLSDTALFLHRVTSNLPDAERDALASRASARPPRWWTEPVLVVDDDVRNIFALTSVLESHGMKVLFAENGKEGHRGRSSRTPTSTSC